MKNDPFSKLLGFIVSNLVAFTIIGLSALLLKNDYDYKGTLVLSEFVIVPIIMGIISSWFWIKVGLSRRQWYAYSCYNSLLSIILSYVFLKEGVICLVIVSPLLFCFVLIGASAGKAMFQRNDNTLNVSIFALLVVVFITDAHATHQYENMVSDSIVINATPDKVWKNVVAFEPIKQKPGYWLFRMGMPSPMATTVTGYYKGAGRKCIFSNGYVL